MAEPSTVGSGCTVRGTVRGAGSLQVEGRIEGQVDVTESVLVLPGSEVHADVKSAGTQVQGSLRGTVEGDRIDLKSTAVVQGELRAETLSVEEGATVRSRVRMKLDLPGDLA